MQRSVPQWLQPNALSLNNMNLPGLELPVISEARDISALRGIAARACDILAASKNESSDGVWENAKGIAARACDILAASKNESSDGVWENAMSSNHSITMLSTPQETAFWKSFVNLHVAELEALEGRR